MAKLNPKNTDAADMFCGLINAAASIFANQLMLGGNYLYTVDGEKILESLSHLTGLIKDYDQVNMNVYRDKIEILK